MHKLTAKQCKTARGLLKWNVYDLANRLNGINARRIESYERSMVHIAEWENDEMVKAFRHEGILFNNDMDVVLIVSEKLDHKDKMSSVNAGGYIKLDAEQNVLEDNTVTPESFTDITNAEKDAEKMRHKDKN